MYTIFCELLRENKVRAADVARATGIATSTLSDWKKGKSIPKADKLRRIADYFNVTVDYLLGKTPYRTMIEQLVAERDLIKDIKFNTPDVIKEHETEYYINEDARNMAKEMYENPELKILFDASKKLATDDLQTVIDLVNRLKRE